jgi:hypothetical protein
MAPEGRAGLLPILCCARKHWSVARLQASHMPIVAERSRPSQSTRAGGLGPSQPTAQPVDSAPTRSASLPRQALRRHSSSVRAVCVNAHVRICAGGDQRWSSLPRQLRRIMAFYHDLREKNAFRRISKSGRQQLSDGITRPATQGPNRTVCCWA